MHKLASERWQKYAETLSKSLGTDHLTFCVCVWGGGGGLSFFLLP